MNVNNEAEVLYAAMFVTGGVRLSIHVEAADALADFIGACLRM